MVLTVHVSPVCRAEVSERVDDGSMHHRGGQLTVTQLVQSSAGENLGISVTNNKYGEIIRK